MTDSYYSTVFEQDAAAVWSAIRDFGDYGWAGITDTRIEDGRARDAVGAIRVFHDGDTEIRQRLLAHSDGNRSFTYGACGPFSTLRHYEGTLHVLPIVDGNRAFVEWSIEFECADDVRDHWSKFFADALPKWLASLRAHLDRRA